jgi:hypothetical protein
MNEIVKSLKIARRGRSGGMGGEDKANLLMRGKLSDRIKKPVRVRQAELDKEKLEKIGRALATDKVAFDMEMKRRREEELAAKELMQDMGFKTVEQMKEEGMKVELRNSTEVLERIALQTLNKQFAQQLIAQRHTLKALTDEHGHMKLNFKLLTKSAREDDEKWQQEDGCVNIAKWERNVMHLRDLMAKAKVVIDSLKQRINKDRVICTLHGNMAREGLLEIANFQKELDRMTDLVREDYSAIQNAESKIKEFSSELAVEVNLFKSGYRNKRKKFETQQRHQKNRAFEDILEEDFGKDKITPAARRMMFKAAAESAKLKRGKERLLHSKRKQKQLDKFFNVLKKATGFKEIDEIVNTIVESNTRNMVKVREQSQLETEISEHLKALNKIKREHLDEIAATSSAKVLARQRQTKQIQAKVSKVARATSKHHVDLENSRKILEVTTKNVMGILKMIKPSSARRLNKFAKQHGDVGNEAILAEALGEVDLWITTTKRILYHNNIHQFKFGSNVKGFGGSSARKKRASILLGQPNSNDQSSIAPSGGSYSERRKKNNDQKFIRPEAPSVEFVGSFTLDQQGDQPKPVTIKLMKSQVGQLLFDNIDRKIIKPHNLLKSKTTVSRRSSMTSVVKPRRSSLLRKR